MTLDDSAVDDPSLKYRKASKLGINSTTDGECKTKYKECTYSSADIISFNYQIEADAEQAESTTTTTPSPASTNKTSNRKVKPNKPKKVASGTTTTAKVLTTSPSTTPSPRRKLRAKTTTTTVSPDLSDEVEKYEPELTATKPGEKEEEEI